MSYVGRKTTLRGEKPQATGNDGGPAVRMHLKEIEPLRELVKVEVRALGRELGLLEKMVKRHPFPGLHLAISIPGEITRERLAVLRKADAIYLEEIKRAGPLRRDLAGLRRAGAGEGPGDDGRPARLARGDLDRREARLTFQCLRAEVIADNPVMAGGAMPALFVVINKSPHHITRGTLSD
jgi:hypothetical protein